MALCSHLASSWPTRTGRSGRRGYLSIPARYAGSRCSWIAHRGVRSCVGFWCSKALGFGSRLRRKNSPAVIQYHPRLASTHSNKSYSPLSAMTPKWHLYFPTAPWFLSCSVSCHALGQTISGWSRDRPCRADLPCPPFISTRWLLWCSSPSHRISSAE